MAEGTSRLEAFSDGVFAIAITLLILEIKVPHVGAEGGLGASLQALWPSYAAFALSFFVILVTWITHHDLIRLCADTSRPMQLANGLTLLYVTFIPFPTAVLAEHLGGPEMKTAVALYCGTFVFGSAAFNLLVATMARSRLCNPEVDLQILRRVRRAFRFTLAFYAATTLLAFWLPWAALGLNIAVRLYLLGVRYRLTPSALDHASTVTS
ncbi:MAG: TMEM175 family protein [Candidatus Eiseniibacteriota bacterium]